MSKKILVMLSEYGFWGEELIGPLDVMDEHGYEMTLMTATGKRPHPLPPSAQAGYFDPPLKKVVTDEYYASKTREVDAGTRLDNPISLKEWFPELPYFNDESFGHKLVDYHKKRDEVWEELKQFDALLLPGGSGPMIDMVNNQRLHDVVLGFLHWNKLIVAECYCVTVLAFARDWSDRRSIIAGKHVTGHAREYDYKDGTGVLGIDANFGPPFYPLEYILRDATQPGGQYHGGVGHEISTVLDYPFLTGRSTQDSRLCGELMVKVLEEGLTRYGW